MLYLEGPKCVEEEQEEQFLLYTANKSKFIYVVQFFDDYALVRSASPEHYGDVHKIDIMTFSREFEEYCGDHEIIRDNLLGRFRDDGGVVDLVE